ncbi:MAG: 1-deoxy-D-xylulose-5-phosphate reductoisomerase [Coriobacteriia bacterium]|nr:1-deoxy-D-xylulose-5-phosphate reductoisomerase [Coriobacteriia bacterium]
MSDRLRVAILGSTGSIGRQALMVAQRFPGHVEVVALAAHSNAELLAEQARSFNVPCVALGDPAAAARARSLLDGSGIAVGTGPQAVVALASLETADTVLNALVGAAGLRSSIAALTAGKRLALANKESLVVGGELVTRLASRGELLPVDSEHSAIYQCLIGERPADLSRIWLTASGGPFRGRSLEELADVTVEQALAHPRWTMGPKITIDSATLMNKGLEAIEAHHLFSVSYERIRIVVHPQSCVHSMVEFTDGSVKAHLGATDMRIPIQYAFSYPERWEAPLPPVDFADMGRLDFEDPDHAAFPCLALALEAGRAGGTMPAVMNAANETVVAAFLDHRVGFLDIPRVVEAVMQRHVVESLESVEQVEATDRWARQVAANLL